MCGEIKPSGIFKRPKYIQCSVKLPSFGVVLVSLVFCMVASETFLQVMHAAVHDSLFYTLTLFVISFFPTEDTWVKQGPLKDTFYINHCQGNLPVLYNARGWLKVAREHATVKQAHPILAESSK